MCFTTDPSCIATIELAVSYQLAEDYCSFPTQRKPGMHDHHLSNWARFHYIHEGGRFASRLWEVSYLQEG